MACCPNEKQRLLKLQQRLIDDLPEGTEADVVNHEKLGLCVRVMLPNDKKIRFRFYKTPAYDAQSSNPEARIFVASHENLHWSDFPYDAIIRLLNIRLNQAS